MRSFLALTAHWISKGSDASTLKLKMALIAFHHVPSSHTGEYLGEKIFELLERANILHKVSHPVEPQYQSRLLLNICRLGTLCLIML